MNNTIAIITIASIFTVFSCKNAEEEESTASRSEALNTDSLTVGVDHASGGFTVKISGNQSIATKKATDCPIQSNGYYTCNFGIRTGPYFIEFLEVPNYATPEPVVVKLTESGGTANGKYKLLGPATGNLTVGVNHASGGFTVKISGNQSIATKKATDCPIQANGYYTCNFGIRTGPYFIEFLEVPNYATPEPVVVKLTESGGTVNVKYKPK